MVVSRHRQPMYGSHTSIQLMPHCTQASCRRCGPNGMHASQVHHAKSGATKGMISPERSMYRYTAEDDIQGCSNSGSCGTKVCMLLRSLCSFSRKRTARLEASISILLCSALLCCYGAKVSVIDISLRLSRAVRVLCGVWSRLPMYPLVDRPEAIYRHRSHVRQTQPQLPTNHVDDSWRVYSER